MSGTTADTGEPQADRIAQWKTEALSLAGNEQAARALVLRIYEAGRSDRHTRDAATINTLEQELAKLRRATITAGS